MTHDPDRPIGVFDSGVGGLTVLEATRRRLPGERFVYLGDTARLPYGTKSPSTVQSYARRAAAFLRDHDIKMLVVACNTASAVALPALARELEPLPVVGVVEPGAAAAAAAAPGGRHLVLATEATVRLHAYRDAIARLDPAARIDEKPCEMMVALAEEGWIDDGIATAVVARYLAEYLGGEGHFGADSVILGCTHFPLLRPAVRAVIGPAPAIVDSAETTAARVAALLDERDLRRSGGNGELRFLATDGARRFARVGGFFLGENLDPADVELVDL